MCHIGHSSIHGRIAWAPAAYHEYVLGSTKYSILPPCPHVELRVRPRLTPAGVWRKCPIRYAKVSALELNRAPRVKAD